MQLRSRDLATALAVGFLLAVAVVEVLRRAAGFPSPRELAASPAALASGKIWLVLTSAFIVSGPPLLELGGVALASALLIHRHGPRMFWRAGAVSHIGSTLIAYAGVGVLWLTVRDAVADVVDRPDYGVSGAWMGVLGALFVSSGRSLARGAERSEALILTICLCSALIGFAFFPLLAGIEHLLAFGLGAGALLADRH
jgi:hypothetical protein